MILNITVDDSTWNNIKTDFNYQKLSKIILELYNKENKIYSDIIFRFPVLNESEINKLNKFNKFDVLFLSKINPDKTFSLSCSKQFLQLL